MFMNKNNFLHSHDGFYEYIYITNEIKFDEPQVTTNILQSFGYSFSKKTNELNTAICFIVKKDWFAVR